MNNMIARTKKTAIWKIIVLTIIIAVIVVFLVLAVTLIFTLWKMSFPRCRQDLHLTSDYIHGVLLLLAQENDDILKDFRLISASVCAFQVSLQQLKYIEQQARQNFCIDKCWVVHHDRMVNEKFFELQSHFSHNWTHSELVELDDLVKDMKPEDKASVVNNIESYMDFCHKLSVNDEFIVSSELPCVKELTSDADTNIMSIATTILEGIPLLLGKDNALVSSHLARQKTETANVTLTINMTCLSDINCVNKLIGTVELSNILSSHLVELSGDLDWKVKHHIFDRLADTVKNENTSKDLGQISLHAVTKLWMADRMVAIFEAAAPSFHRTTNKLARQWEEAIFETQVIRLATDNNSINRITSLFIVMEAVTVMEVGLLEQMHSKFKYENQMVSLINRLVTDKSPDVRFSVLLMTQIVIDMYDQAFGEKVKPALYKLRQDNNFFIMYSAMEAIKGEECVKW